MADLDALAHRIAQLEKDHARLEQANLKLAADVEVLKEQFVAHRPPDASVPDIPTPR